ncbi:MAG: energy transducer TonB [Serpentinimonas sp.]|nr:energy transducer TonB [Serpentinimonas sp.]
MKLLRSLSTLQIALAVSVLAHAALLSVRFVAPEQFNRVFQDTPLEVILVNARSDEKPDVAQAIAQANLAGGGEAASGRATSPLPPSAEVRLGESMEEEQRRIEALKEQQNRLLAQLRDRIAALPAPQPDVQNLTPEQVQREEQRQALIRTLAEIERRVNEENARPRKRYVSPATREEVYAVYYDDLRRKIEDRGTSNFPAEGGRKLYGELTMVITVNFDGRVLATEVVQTSGQPVLDRRAQAIVQSLTFARFNQAMRQRADQIVVVSRFRFTRDETLRTQMSGN